MSIPKRCRPQRDKHDSFTIAGRAGCLYGMVKASAICKYPAVLHLNPESFEVRCAFAGGHLDYPWYIPEHFFRLPGRTVRREPDWKLYFPKAAGREVSLHMGAYRFHGKKRPLCVCQKDLSVRLPLTPSSIPRGSLSRCISFPCHAWEIGKINFLIVSNRTPHQAEPLSESLHA